MTLSDRLDQIGRTLRLLATGHCEAFDDAGLPATITAGPLIRWKIAHAWWFW